MLFEKFEDDPDNFFLISENLRNNPSFRQHIKEYGVKNINIETDKIVYKVPQKFCEYIEGYFTALIKHAVKDLEKVTEEITDEKWIQFYNIHQVWIVSQFKRDKVKSQFFEGKVSDASKATKQPAEVIIDVQSKWCIEVESDDEEDCKSQTDKTKNEKPYLDD